MIDERKVLHNSSNLQIKNIFLGCSDRWGSACSTYKSYYGCSYSSIRQGCANLCNACRKFLFNCASFMCTIQFSKRFRSSPTLELINQRAFFDFQQEIVNGVRGKKDNAIKHVEEDKEKLLVLNSFQSKMAGLATVNPIESRDAT